MTLAGSTQQGRNAKIGHGPGSRRIGRCSGGFPSPAAAKRCTPPVHCALTHNRSQPVATVDLFRSVPVAGQLALGRCVDVEAAICCQRRQRKRRLSGQETKPSDRLGPSTPLYEEGPGCQVT